MAKILFISDNLLNEGLGIMYLSSYVKTGGHEVALTLLAEHERGDALIHFVEEEDPDLVGFSVMTPQVPQFRAISKILKERTGRRIVWGGPHCMFMQDDVMKYDFVDIICVGDGEEALLELLNRIDRGEDYHDLPSLYVRSGSGWRRNPVGELTSNLDKYPFPDRDLYYTKYPLLAKFPLKRLITSRGCPYKCSYCFEPSYFKMYMGKGKIIRRHSVEYVIGEIRNITRKYPLKLVHFSDDIFNLNKRWISEFAAEYAEKIRLPFTCNIELSSVDPEVIEILSRAGCHGVTFGLESGVERIRMNVLNKKITNRRYLEITKLLHQHNILFLMNVMFCLPSESLDDAIESIRFAAELQPFGIRPGILKMYKGTEVANHCRANGLTDGVGEFTYRVKDIHGAFQQISNMMWAGSLFVRFPFSIRFAKFILPRKWAKFFKPLLLRNYWEDIRFFKIPLNQAWQLFRSSSHVLKKGVGGEQADQYVTEETTAARASERELFEGPTGIVDWSGKEHRETYVSEEEKEGDFSSMRPEILDALRACTHPNRKENIVELGMVSGISMVDGEVRFRIVDSGPLDKALSERLRREAAKAVEKVPGVLRVTVE